VGVTYVAVEVDVVNVVVGFYTLASSSIAKALLSDDLGRRLPRYPHVPVALLARLAVDRRFQGRGVGPELLAPPSSKFSESKKPWGAEASLSTPTQTPFRGMRNTVLFDLAGLRRAH